MATELSVTIFLDEGGEWSLHKDFGVEFLSLYYLVPSPCVHKDPSPCLSGYGPSIVLEFIDLEERPESPALSEFFGVQSPFLRKISQLEGSCGGA